MASHIRNSSTPTIVKRIGVGRRVYLSEAKIARLLQSSLRPLETMHNKGSKVAFTMSIQTASRSFRSHHVFENGREFWPVLPRGLVRTGEIAVVRLEPLTLRSFLSGLPIFELKNRDRAKWVSERVRVESFLLDGRVVRIRFSQTGCPNGLARFELALVLDTYPGRCNQSGGVFLQCHLVDYFGRPFPIRICHNGVDPPLFQLNRGAGFESVSLVSFDGVRLSFRYGVSGTTSVVYLAGPHDSCFMVGPSTPYSGRYLDLVAGMHRGASVCGVSLLDEVELGMYQHGSAYDQGRLGSEIAYFCAKRCLHLEHVVIEEPSKAGRDLYTEDQTVSLQARMIGVFKARRARAGSKLKS